MEDREHGASLAQIVNAETALEQARMHIARLENEATRLRLAVEGLQEALDERHRDIDAISVDLAQRSSELADLSLSHKKLTALYVATVRSTSWRITAPLRWLGKVVQPMLGTTQQSPAAAHRAPTIELRRIGGHSTRTTRSSRGMG